MFDNKLHKSHLLLGRRLGESDEHTAYGTRPRSKQRSGEPLTTCAEFTAPPEDTFGGCLPCKRSNSSGLAIPAAYGRCLRCLVESRRPFLIGRPGMGAPEEVTCALVTKLGQSIAADAKSQQAVNETKKAFFGSKMIHTLKVLNGVATSSEEDVKAYGQCYWAALNRSDLIVRLGGEMQMTLRKPLDVCTRTGSKHFHKVDIMLAHSGHFPSRLLHHLTLNPWTLMLDLLAGRLQRGDAWLGASGTTASQAAHELDEDLEQLDHSSNWSHTRSAVHSIPASWNSTEVNDAFSWVTALRGRTVAIVSPFNQSISQQLAKGPHALWGRYARHVMPTGIRFKPVASPQNLAKHVESAGGWRDAFDELIARVDAAMPFDVALIGCGGLGMPLAAYLRATNRSAMYNGGDLQLWFGVYGKRWLYYEKALAAGNHSFFRNWVRPSAAETPTGAGLVEGGTYW